MRVPTWIALGVVGIQAMLALAGMMPPLTLGAIAYAVVSRRNRRP